MDWEYGFDYDESECKYCAAPTSKEFCCRECAEEYESDN